MPYLFDSNALLHYINGVPRARELITRPASSGVSISTIAHLEVLDGIPASPDPDVAKERFDRLLTSVRSSDSRGRKRSGALRYDGNFGERLGRCMAVMRLKTASAIDTRGTGPATIHSVAESLMVRLQSGPSDIVGMGLVPIRVRTHVPYRMGTSPIPTRSGNLWYADPSMSSTDGLGSTGLSTEVV